jgi:hypothetical protein
MTLCGPGYGCAPDVLLVLLLRPGMFASVARRGACRSFFIPAGPRIHAAPAWRRPPALSAPRLPHTTTRRVFRHLAPTPDAPPAKPAAPPPAPASEAAKPTPEPLARADEALTPKEQRRRDWAIIRQLVPHVWPANDWSTKSRIVLGVGLLVAGKVRSRCGEGGWESVRVLTSRRRC